MNKNKFTIGLIWDGKNSNKKEQKKVLTTIKAAAELEFKIFISVKNNEELLKNIEKIQQKNPKQITLFDFSEESHTKILKKVESLICMNPLSQRLFQAIRRGGVVPIAPIGSQFEDFNAQEEKGNSFLYAKDTEWGVMTALIRASENYKFSYDWKNLKKNVQKMKI